MRAIGSIIYGYNGPMADIFSKAARSRMMSAIRSRGNRETEVRLARLLRRNKIIGWRRHRNLPGRPDFVFLGSRVAVFIDGCFWHCCPKHGRRPSSNRSYWLPKLKMNQSRDRRVDRELRTNGWKVVRVWEHELKDEGRVVNRIARVLGPNASLVRLDIGQASAYRPKQSCMRQAEAQHFRSAGTH